MNTKQPNLRFDFVIDSIKYSNSHSSTVCSCPSGSEEERIAVETASRFGSKPTLYPSPTENDVSIEIVMDGTGPRIGGDAKLSIVLKNTSSKQRTASLLYEVMVMYYTGVLKDTVKKDRIPVDLKPQESEWSLMIKLAQPRLFSGYCKGF